MLNKMKRIAVLLFTFLLLAGLVSIVVLAEQGSGSKKAPGTSANASAGALSSYVKAAENKRLELYVNQATLGIKVKDKDNGYVWHGTLDEKDEQMNNTWQSFFQSGLTVEYMDSKRKVRMAPVTAEKAKVSVQNRKDGFSAKVLYDKLGISLDLDVTLTEDAVEFKVPAASIGETGKDNRLQSIYLYPFLGGMKGVQTDRGYMLIPDGSGALVSLNEQTIATQPFTGRVYGDDRGMKGSMQFREDTLAHIPEQIYLPVYGIAHTEGESALVSMITGGAPYAEIRSYPAGVTTAYNWTAARWIYREDYFQPVDKKGKGITLNQEEKNQFDASLKVMLLAGEDADYSGMAGRVQRELIQQGELPDKKQDGTDSLPLRLEFLAADKQQKMIGSEVIPMTTEEEMEVILDDLRENQVDRMMVIVRGYTEGGASGTSPVHFPLEEKVANGNQWKNFVEKYKTLGIPVYFYTDYVMADKSADGYGKEDIAQSASKQLISLFDMRYLLQPAASQRLYEREISAFRKNGMANLAMDSIGSNLFSTYEKSASTRSDSIEAYQSMLSRNAADRVALYRPNPYLWKYTDRIIDLPMSSSGFLLESEEVPFLQLVLKGYIDYYAPPSNFHSNPQEELLKMVDYGSYPSFILTDEDPIRMSETGSSWIYTSQYAVWKEQVVKDYQTIVEALQPVAGAAFEKREQVREGVIKNRYSNGTVIYINYTRHEVTVDGSPVPAQGFLVKEGGRL